LAFLQTYPLSARQPESIYTVQIASLEDIKQAQEQFDLVTQKLDKNQLDYLRIEKIGKYYSLRIGKFKDRASAKSFLKSIKSSLPSAIIMRAYFIEGRILRIYKRPEKPIEEAKPVEKPIPKKEIVKIPVKPEETKPLEEKISTIASLVDKKDFNKALEIIKKEIALQPESPELNAWYGTVLLKINKPSEALKYLQKAIELSPNVSDYHNATGYCLFFLNKPERAIDEFNKALALDPEHVDALTGLGIIYAKKGEKEKAMEIYNKLKGLDKNTAERLLKVIESPSL
jgi:tetratricopeptide (TPR) repeat protein